jgi:hypothetical protein
MTSLAGYRRPSDVGGDEIGLAYGGASEMVAVDNTVLDSSAMGMALEAPRSGVRGGEIRGAPRGVASARRRACRAS